jgi:hypothetical protein
MRTSIIGKCLGEIVTMPRRSANGKSIESHPGSANLL